MTISDQHPEQSPTSTQIRVTQRRNIAVKDKLSFRQRSALHDEVLDLVAKGYVVDSLAAIGGEVILSLSTQETWSVSELIDECNELFNNRYKR